MANTVLTKQQKEAVEYFGGPLLIVAGAGTGKTRVITEKIAYAIEKKNVSPGSILALTFTDNAAGEMYNRAFERVPFGVDEPRICTFHSFAQDIVGEYGIHIGLSNLFTLQEEAASLLLMRDVLKKARLKFYKSIGNPLLNAKELLDIISRAKDELLTPDLFAAQIEDMSKNADADIAGDIARLREVAHIYDVYQQALFEKGKMDFGDLLLFAHQIIATVPQAARALRGKYRHVYVDEFQDVNTAQYQCVKELYAKESGIITTVVGDDDQAIYGFRGSRVELMLQFTKDFTNTHTVVLTDNFRSGQNILDASYRLITKNNPNRLECQLNVQKKLLSHVPQKGDISFTVFDTAEEEALFVCERIAEIHASGVPYGNIAVLSRGWAHSTACVLAFENAGIPTDAAFHAPLLNTPVVLDMIAFLRMIFIGDEAAIFRVLSMSIWEIPSEDIRKLTIAAKTSGLSLSEMCNEFEGVDGISPHTKKALLCIRETGQMLVREQSGKMPSQLVFRMLEQSGIYAKLLKDVENGVLESVAAVDHIHDFLSFVSSCESSMLLPQMQNVISHIDILLATRDEEGREKQNFSGDVVRVMTAHGSKGLEFHTVFVVSASNDRFPGKNNSSSLVLPEEYNSLPRSREAFLVEERRLMYVALTRSTHNCFVSTAKFYGEGAKREKRISGFIIEAGIEEVRHFPKDFNNKDAKKERKTENILSPRDLPISPMQLSFSAFRSYADCPYQYKIGHVLGVPTQQTPSASFGSSIHLTLQKIGARLQEQTGSVQSDIFGESGVRAEIGISVDDAVQFLHDSWVRGGYESIHDQDMHKEDAEKRIRAYALDSMARGWRVPLRMEKGFSLHIGETKFSGRIDAIFLLPDGTLELVDYKTGKPKETLDARHKQQLLLYQLAFLRLDDLKMLGKVSKLSYCYITEDGPVYTSFLGTDEELSRMVGEVEEVSSSIEAGYFEAKPAKYTCDYCPFRTICQFRII